MLLEDKNAVVYGGGGGMGGAFARAFAREGARIFLAGRTQPALDKVAGEITDEGGIVDTALVDALDPVSVAMHLDDVVDRAGRLDICVNAVGIPVQQGTALVDMELDEFTDPITGNVRTQFVTATAAARRMIPNSSGVLLSISASPARLPGPNMGGFGIACASIEAMTRHLAGELGQHGIRVVCIRPNKLGDHGMLPPQAAASLAAETLLGRLPTLAETANTAAFLVSDHAGAMTGTIANLTCGTVVD
jgi:NAD(P)-dependent dehydrogenase (short-subunit alcohol dehydrogenase family)